MTTKYNAENLTYHQKVVLAATQLAQDNKEGIFFYKMGEILAIQVGYKPFYKASKRLSTVVVSESRRMML